MQAISFRHHVVIEKEYSILSLLLIKKMYFIVSEY